MKSGSARDASKAGNGSSQSVGSFIKILETVEKCVDGSSQLSQREAADPGTAGGVVSAQ